MPGKESIGGHRIRKKTLRGREWAELRKGLLKKEKYSGYRGKGGKTADVRRESRGFGKGARRGESEEKGKPHIKDK